MIWPQVPPGTRDARTGAYIRQPVTTRTSRSPHRGWHEHPTPAPDPRWRDVAAILLGLLRRRRSR